jgi:hypothetical protein
MWVGVQVTRVIFDANIQEGMVYRLERTDQFDDATQYPAFMVKPER